MTEADLAREAAVRTGGHVRELRSRWPGLLADMKGMRGQPDIPEWPDWCWLPMSAVGSYLQASGRPYRPTEIGVSTAVGLWRLLGKRIVVPSEEVATDAIPEPNGPGPEGADVLLPRDALLEDLAGACYYLVTPVPRPEGKDGDGWVYGCYVHLESDHRPGQGAELRLLADTADSGLVPVPVILDQPTLAWSSSHLMQEASLLGPGLAEAMTGQARLLAWLVWPLLGALLNHDTELTRTDVLDGENTAVDVRGTEVWQITYTRPGHLRPAGPDRHRAPASHRPRRR